MKNNRGRMIERRKKMEGKKKRLQNNGNKRMDA